MPKSKKKIAKKRATARKSKFVTVKGHTRTLRNGKKKFIKGFRREIA